MANELATVEIMMESIEMKEMNRSYSAGGHGAVRHPKCDFTKGMDEVVSKR
ncbi:hypothetical protein [Paenibacillus sp. FSL H8-0259]|uniref:hypothetical protein n=1 Tax=Paenibacillus sp. FSL H8-0259 TaxID=1920423 RepID=UPI002117213D|nr:hypothetical protein [Paenibacillus sp. FSL H8-0259]